MIAVMVARRLPGPRAALPDVAALVVAGVVPLFMSTAVWGVLQRLMFVTAGAWYAREAVRPPTGGG